LNQKKKGVIERVYFTLICTAMSDEKLSSIYNLNWFSNYRLDKVWFVTKSTKKLSYQAIYLISVTTVRVSFWALKSAWVSGLVFCLGEQSLIRPCTSLSHTHSHTVSHTHRFVCKELVLRRDSGVFGLWERTTTCLTLSPFHTHSLPLFPLSLF
jgi:hypothetical protein